MTASSSRARTRSPTSRARRSTSSSCRSRTTCWRAALDSVGLTERDITRRQHLGRRHGRRLSSTDDVTAVVTWNPLLSEIAAHRRRQQGVQFLADPRRDHRHDGGQHRDAEGQPGFRQGAGRRLVRDDGRHVEGRRGRQRRHARPWRGLRHRPRRLRRAARDDADVLRPGRGRRLHQRAPSWSTR